MLQGFIGEENLKLGLGEYLEAHKFKNAETNDLWDAFSQQVCSTVPQLAAIKMFPNTCRYRLTSTCEQ